MTTRPTATSAPLRGETHVELLAGQGHPQQQDAHPADDERGPEVVDGDLALDDRQVQAALEDDQGCGGDRDRDEEAPAPAQRAVDDDAPDERAADGGQCEDRADVAGVATALTRADQRGDDDLHQGREPTDAEPLHRASADQHAHGRRERRDQGARGEDQQRGLDEDLLRVEVGQLAPQRRGRRHGQQRRHHDPRVAGLGALEVGHDPRQRVGHHRAGHHGHEHRQQQAAHRLEHLAVRHGSGGLDDGDGLGASGVTCRRGAGGGRIGQLGHVVSSHIGPEG